MNYHFSRKKICCNNKNQAFRKLNFENQTHHLNLTAHFKRFTEQMYGDITKVIFWDCVKSVTFWKLFIMPSAIIFQTMHNCKGCWWRDPLTKYNKDHRFYKFWYCIKNYYTNYRILSQLPHDRELLFLSSHDIFVWTDFLIIP